MGNWADRPESKDNQLGDHLTKIDVNRDRFTDLVAGHHATFESEILR